MSVQPSPASPARGPLHYRLAYFRLHTAALYRRYGQALLLLLTLGGLVLAERPALLAGPLTLYAFRPFDTALLAAGTAGWLAAVFLWVRAHRPFVQGGALAAYCASLPVPAHRARAVDLGVLAACLTVALVPFGVAAFTVWRSAAPSGLDGWFWAYLAALAAVTLACGRAVAYGATPAGWGAVAAAALAAVLAPRLPFVLAPAAVLLACVCAWTGTARPRAAAPPRRAALSRPPLFSLLALQAFVLLRRRWDAFLPRLLWALLPLAFDWYLIHEIGNAKPARILLHAGLAAAAGLLAGCHTLLDEARAPMQGWLRSMPRGRWLPALADTAVVSACALAVLGAALLAMWLTVDVYTGAELLRAGLWYVLLAPLFGVPALYRHAQAVPLKAALAFVWIVTGFNTL